MHYNSKMVKNPLQSVFNDLKLFEQDNYCYNYLKEKFGGRNSIELIEHSKVASSCFRQASEYYKSAINASINTNPLLFSYALNNLLKGVCYLKSFDEKILNGFKAHGFKVDSKYLMEDALESKITIMNQKGAVHSLLELYENSLMKQDIPLYKVLRHIPDIDNFYFKSVGSIAMIAKSNSRGKNTYVISGNKINAETKNIFTSLSFGCDIICNHDDCYCYETMKTLDYFKNNVFNRKNVYYRDYVNIPEQFDEGLKDINISFYCYLLIMTYGMMVRYNPNIWEEYIDKRKSSYSVLIELSIPNAVNNFYYQMHYQLFGFYYEDDSYTEKDIKKVINESTSDIMNNINDRIKDQSFAVGSKPVFPWRNQ